MVWSESEFVLKCLLRREERRRQGKVRKDGEKSHEWVYSYAASSRGRQKGSGYGVEELEASGNLGNGYV
jgi:hypothetical protein